MRVPSKLWDNRPIIKVEKIILHDPGNNQTAAQLISWLNSPQNTHCVGYHDIIEGHEIYGFTPHNLRAVHAGVFQPTELWTRGRTGTQNAYSLGVCITRQMQDWDFVGKYLERLCARHDLHPMDDVMCHFQINCDKSDPQQWYDHLVEFRDWLAMIATGVQVTI